MKDYNLIIIGGGASAILCAIEASKKGIDDILLIEKDPVLGGALNLGNYNISKDSITGKEYKEKLLKELEKCSIDIKLDTMALKIEENNEVLCTSKSNGIEKIKGKKIIIANGAKEGSRKALNMLGDRCSGILTVGMAKKIFSMGIIPGKNILVEGGQTLYMIEKELKEHNIKVEIISDDENCKTYGLTDKIYHNYNITSIEGNGRVESVRISNKKDEKIIKCDTVLFARNMISDGLVAMRSNIKLNPKTTGAEVDENFMTSRKDIFACGNGIYIHDYIEDIEKECRDLIQKLEF